MASNWKDVLEGQIPPDRSADIETFAGQVELRKQKKVDEKVFAETRLRWGIYGQRYDNGQRYDGVKTQTIVYPAGDLTKGPTTFWDAPGMLRIKIPFGGVNPEQMEVLAQVADEYSDGILHVTTRQDFQLHFVHIEDTPDLMRRLAAVGITSQEACGNTVRNITGCPLAGVCHDEAFDVTPYTKAMAYFLLGHGDTQDFGRKFKTAFSGCEQHACALVNMHDFGLLARTKVVDGETKRGFAVFVGGGLGTVPQQAKLLDSFVSEEEIMPIAQSIARVFARLGEKKNRNRARMKFLVEQVGIEEFRRLVFAERETLSPDIRWTEYLNELPNYKEIPAKQPFSLNGQARPEGFEEWYQTNIYKQRQEGYAVVYINLPLGDMTSMQMFKLADLARKYAGDSVRTTVEQNMVLRWVSESDLPELYSELKAVGLAKPGIGTIVDITSCPGTDTCKLGIASSRGLSGELAEQLTAKMATMHPAVKELKLKVSGCFNSCGQHHVADIGFFGNSRRSGNYLVPHFQVVLGGKWKENGGSFGMAIGAVPSKRVPEVLEAITNRYAGERNEGENFQTWVTRLGKKEIKTMLEPFTKVPDHDVDPSFYTDWGDTREYSLGDIGIGECAGEVVSLFSMEIAKAESNHFEGLVAFDEGNYVKADQSAYRAMLLAAYALVRTRFLALQDEPNKIVDEFRRTFFDTKLFFDPYAGGKFANYLFDRHENPPTKVDADTAQHTLDEAQLFIEACHSAESRVNGSIIGLNN
ncbi:MAG: nitrite/sulfite reductase [Anaerolineae bacterium]|nr:nitrite/sulfite reductase [Anaerolineae bacterium]